MKITVMSVGKTQDSAIRTLMDTYQSRIKHYVAFEWIEIPDYKNRGKVSFIELKRIEGEAILAKINRGDVVYLLDERGTSYTSVQLSDLFHKKMIAGVKHLVFVIGGAYGFSEPVYTRSMGLISLSKLTFPHQLIRIFWLEQIYRGFTIINRTPYHHP